MPSARSSGRSTAWAVPAATKPPTTPARRTRCAMRDIDCRRTLANSLSHARVAPTRRALVAATAASLHAGGAARAFAHFAHVFDVLLRQAVARQFHDRVGQALALV